MIEVPKIAYFKGKNTWCACKGDMCLRIAPNGDKLDVFIWKGPWCFEKTPQEQIKTQDFEFSQEGLAEISKYLEDSL